MHSLQTELKRLKSIIRTLRWRKWRSAWSDHGLRRKTEKLTRKERERDRLHDVHALRLQTLGEIETTLKNLEQNETIVRDELAGRSGGLGEPLPQQGMEIDLIQRIKQRAATYRRQLREQEALAGRLETLESRRKALPSELIQLREETETLAATIKMRQQRISTLKAEHEALFGGKDPVHEDRELESRITLATREQTALTAEIEPIRRAITENEQIWPETAERAEAAQSAAQQAEQELMQQALPLDIQSLEELQDALVVLENQEAVAKRWATAEQTLSQARSRCEAVQTSLASLRARGDVEEMPLDALQDQSAEAEKRRGYLQEEADSAVRSLQEQREAERLHREALAAVTAQEKIHARTVAEEKALESKDPVAIKTKLQRLMFERLLDRANQQLESLNGRYHLRPLSEEGLGLHVEDALQGGKCRPTKTLSGGESFQVSLCLALGLAEMAGRDRKIESLFLDEGFGALDDEMLYKVMVALKGLRANGKMVGVISHVKRLADEIPTQIRLEKQRGGRSTLSIVA